MVTGFGLSSFFIVYHGYDCQTYIKKTGKRFLRKRIATIRAVASFPGVEYGRLFYSKLEIENIIALKINRGNYDALLHISEGTKSDLRWWPSNMETV